MRGPYGGACASIRYRVHVCLRVSRSMDRDRHGGREAVAAVASRYANERPDRRRRARRLEAALALHRLAAEQVDVTVLAPEAEFIYRPLSVLEPFAAGGGTTYPLERIAADAGFTHLRGRLASVDTGAREVHTVTGERLAYDGLLVASGARPVTPFTGAVAFRARSPTRSASTGSCRTSRAATSARWRSSSRRAAPAGAPLRAGADARRARVRDGRRRRPARRHPRGRAARALRRAGLARAARPARAGRHHAAHQPGMDARDARRPARRHAPAARGPGDPRPPERRARVPRDRRVLRVSAGVRRRHVTTSTSSRVASRASRPTRPPPTSRRRRARRSRRARSPPSSRASC